MAADTSVVDNLQAALLVRRSGDRSFTTSIPAGWQQGRGAFGGLVLGILARALESCVEEPDRTLRTLSGEIIAPVMVGEAQIEVELLRRGSGLSSLYARLLQDGEVRAHASAIYAKTRVTDRELLTLSPPALTPWPDVEVIPVQEPFGPMFAQWFEYRSTGPFPFSGGTEPMAEGWISSKKTVDRFGAPELIAYIDAWWPTTFAVESGPRPMATIAFTFQLHLDGSTLDPNEPLMFRARTQAAHDGYISELRELWTADGRLVALNPQTFTIIR